MALLRRMAAAVQVVACRMVFPSITPTASALPCMRPSLLSTRPLSTAASGSVLMPGSTVFALSSGSGKCGVAVVRVSGPAATVALTALTPTRRQVSFEPRRATLAELRDPATGDVLDQAVVLTFPGPGSYTGEDIVELHVHGGRAVVDGLLTALSGIEGLEPAQPGEFTRRAFFNGKLDLTEVEAVADLLNADTEALSQLQGSLRKLYSSWRAELVGCLAHTEAVIDFGEDEDDCNDAVYTAVEGRVRVVADAIQQHLDDGRRGEIIRNGLILAIVGPPNAGKSSLLNVLARRPAAIVSAIPGTTRDVVEVAFDLSGYPVTLSDTAGLRDTEDVIEAEGVARAVQRASSADVRVAVFDAADLGQAPADDATAAVRTAVVGGADDQPVVVVLNKADVCSDAVMRVALGCVRDVVGPSPPVVALSCELGAGVPALMSCLETVVAGRFDTGVGTATTGAFLTRARHRHHLTQCAASLRAFLAQPGEVDLAAEELRLAVHSLGVVTGAVDVEELLDVVFADFCIGK